MNRMAKKKPDADRHKPSFMVRIPARFQEILDRLAEARVTDITAEVIRAVREMLEREGLWPPPPKVPGSNKEPESETEE